MLPLRFSVAFFALLVVTVAIKCYTQTTTGDDKPVTNAECAVSQSSKYCMKTKTQANGKTINNYSCGSSICTTNGCSSLQKGVIMCCCDKDLCNSSTRLSLLFIVFPAAVAKLLLF